MKILVVVGGNSNLISTFIMDQVIALNTLDVKTEYFTINGKGIIGYLKSFPKLLKSIKKYKPNLIHAHYGLSGLLSVIQRKIPVIITFHGSDVNNRRVRLLSRLASLFSIGNIFVSNELLQLMPSSNSFVIPCGVDIEIFKPMHQAIAKKKFGLKSDKKYILFSSRFDNAVKNYPLAKSAVSLLNNNNIELLELKGYSRIQVAHLMNAVDMVLMTSFTEGSPQFIKEAMACNISIVSTNIGDVKEVIGKTVGYFLTSFDPEDVADKIKQALSFGKRTTGRENIRHLKADLIAQKIIKVYNKVIEKESVEHQ